MGMLLVLAVVTVLLAGAAGLFGPSVRQREDRVEGEAAVTAMAVVVAALAVVIGVGVLGWVAFSAGV